MTDLPVSQRAREAAAWYLERVVGKFSRHAKTSRGDEDGDNLVQAFARFEADTKAEAEVLREALNEAHGRAACFSDKCLGCADNVEAIKAALNHGRQAS